jgi:hypothetical protein
MKTNINLANITNQPLLKDDFVDELSWLIRDQTDVFVQDADEIIDLISILLEKPEGVQFLSLLLGGPPQELLQETIDRLVREYNEEEE